jgi:hypothetical protein
MEGRDGCAGAAIAYARSGWLAIPLHNPVRNGGCSCGDPECSSPAKHPRTLHGLHDATTDVDVIDRWFQQWPHANVGVLTGPRSGLMVVDVDGPEGEASLAALQSRHGELPSTKVITTGRGRHLWFRYPEARIGNSAGKLGPHLDVRGDGGYVIAPPSAHVSGRRYRVLHRGGLADLPRWMIALLVPRRPDPTRVPAPPLNAGRAITGWPAPRWAPATTR